MLGLLFLTVVSFVADRGLAQVGPQPLQVTVTIPWNRVRWSNLGLVNPTTVTYTVVWRMAIDDPFTVNDTLPTY